MWAPAFFALELPAHFKLVPWPTLSRTFWDLIAWWHPMAYFVLVAMVVLLGHFEKHWSVRYLIAVALMGTAAAAAHLILRG